MSGLRRNAHGELMEDGCWSCAHYGDHGGRGGGTPPWPVCRFHLDHPKCGRWQFAEQPWRYDFDWRGTAIRQALSTPRTQT